ncbi:MAG: 2-oxoacid:acceptor oxidoreductase family protein [Candidatus Poribacteria bacterium]|nr:2-oxoacid:acceptor oxidoreductase family protein [Candidatus Poribacteria bacterium]
MKWKTAYEKVIEATNPLDRTAKEVKNMDDRFTQASGTHVYTGCELLVKGALESGVSLLTGYPGSPIAEVFDVLQRNAELLKNNGIIAQIANNEALSIARLNGSQMADVRAIAFMKSVGLHVASDALAISNLAGTTGGAVVVVGDDTWSHSTQVPADSRFLARHVYTPLIEPSTFQELKDWVHCAFQISAAADLYVCYLTTENQASGGGNVELQPNIYPDITELKRVSLDTQLIDADKRVVLPPHTAQIETETFQERLPTALETARDLGLNKIQFVGDPSSQKRYPLGFVSAGLAHSCLLHALGELNLYGDIPVLKLGMTHPIDADIVREFTEQVDEIYVVEEKRPLLENEIKALLTQMYQDGGIKRYVSVWGKQFPDSLAGIPAASGLDASILIQKLIPLFKHRLSTNSTPVDLEHLTCEETLQKQVSEQQIDIPQRTPTFCPGCPHRDSSSVFLEITRQFMDTDYMKKHHNSVPVDLVFHGDIGCYSMLKYEPFPRLMHNLSAMALGGGSGAGIDPFIENKQIVFMGDSTFFHGGMAAISDSIKNNQDIAYIILDNQTTAMTGHQPTPAGELDLLGNPTFAQDIEQVAQGLAGDSEIDIVRTNPEDRVNYKKHLEKTILKPGIKIVIADKECAITYHRRLRREQRKTIAKDGFLKYEKHINITPEVCEFCRECTTATGCPGLKVVDTDYGDKIAIDQSNCVSDGACARIKYACPAFEEVIVTRKRPPQAQMMASAYRDLLSDDPLPPPPPLTFERSWNTYAAGVGGMGIGTISKVLVVAGYFQGYDVTFCDRKGLAIRNGGVYTHIAYTQPSVHASPMIPYGKADLLLGLDILEAVRGITPRSLFRVASPDRTVAVVNTAKTETITTLIGKDDFDPDALEETLQTHTKSEAYFGIDLFTASEQLFGNKLYANMMLLGTAFQRRLIPLELEPLQLALKQMVPHADLETNMKAFNVGRRLALDSQQLVDEAPRESNYAEMLSEKRQILESKRGGKRLAQRYATLVESAVETMDVGSDNIHRLLALYTYDLVQFEGINYARMYIEKVKQVCASDSESYSYRATKAAIRYLHKVMLIKDEVYVAHLLTSKEKLERDKALYKVDTKNGDRIKYVHLNRPHFTVMGFDFETDIDTHNWQLNLMKRMKFLRRLLPEWHAKEKAFREWYISRVIDTFAPTDAETYDKHLRALESVEEVRGYREIRYPKMEAAKQTVEELLGR